jgi:hypothetical protein
LEDILEAPQETGTDRNAKNVSEDILKVSQESGSGSKATELLRRDFGSA